METPYSGIGCGIVGSFMDLIYVKQLASLCQDLAGEVSGVI